MTIAKAPCHGAAGVLCWRTPPCLSPLKAARLSNSTRLAIAALLLFLTALGLMLTLNAGPGLPGPAELAAWLRGFGAWAPLAVVLLMIAHSFIPFPAEIVALCAGAVFGTLSGAALVWIGAMLGAILSFWLARRLGRGFVESRLSPENVARLDRFTRDRGTMTLLICRFIPLIAFNLINYAAGLTRVRIATFLWTTGVGILPITLLATWLGARMKDMSWPMLLAVSGISIAVIWAIHALSRRRGWV